MVPTLYDLWEYVTARSKELAQEGEGDMWLQRTPERVRPEQTSRRFALSRLVWGGQGVPHIM